MNIEKLAIEAGFEVFNGRIGLLGAEKIHDVTEQLEAFAKTLQSSEPVAEARVKELEALSVTNIMINVVPGFDGMGEEVYAKSVADVEKIINEMSIKLDAYEHNTLPPSTVPLEKYNKLLDAFKSARNTLEFANELGGPISDTIWHGEAQTLFDFMDSIIAEAEGKEG